MMRGTPPHPVPFQGDLHNLPEALAPLKAYPNWVCWKFVWKVDKKGIGNWTKPPYRPDNPTKYAKNNDPSTWGTYEQALAAFKAGQCDGIGFCLLGTDIAAFDIDKCRDPTTGDIAPEAMAIVNRAESYTEMTPSGTGLRVLGRGSGSKVHRKQKLHGCDVEIESYRDAERYITITGNPLPSTWPHMVDISAVVDAVVVELEGGEQEAEAEDASTASDTNTKDDNEPQLAWSKVASHAGWLKTAADLPMDFSAKGKLIVGHSGNLKDLNIDLKRAGLVEKPFTSWSEVSFALAAIFKFDGRFTREQIAAALLCDLHCNQHVTRQGNEQRAVERVLTRSHEPTKQRIARALPWRECKANGAPVPSLHNAMLAITALGIACRHDTFHNTMLVGFKGDDIQHELQSIVGEVTDNVILRLRHFMSERFGLDFTVTHTRDAVITMALDHCFDPVRDMLAKAEKEWDGVERLDKMAVDYFNCADTPLNRAFIRKMMIAAVHRARHPGCKFDSIVVLESDEGWDKSTAFSVLAGDENFSDQSILGKREREIQETMAGVWIHESGDLSGMSKAQVEEVKAFASRQVDRGRPAYGHFPIKQPRAGINVGTTNADTYLQSQTGNRRFWPLKVLKPIDSNLLRRDRLQLWGEAAKYESAGESNNIPKELWAAAAVEQEKRRAKDPWEDTLANIPKSVRINEEDVITIVHIVDDQERVSSFDLLTHVLGIPKGPQDRRHTMRLSDVMKHLGWQRDPDGNRIWIGGKQQRGYFRLLPHQHALPLGSPKAG